MTVPRPGEIYWAYLGGEPRHPCIVVSHEELNRGDYFVAVQLTSNKLESRRSLPNCVWFKAGQFGLPKDCVSQGETVTFLDKQDVDWAAGSLGVLDGSAMRDLIRSIGYVISADCEPR